ncbi:MAG: ATP-binding protein [Candidatus Woesearchaeota archaeon]|nr:ATP-binding protein [Candidatus Woesearchaeota archaeon]
MIYDLPLIDWISIGLNQQSLQTATSAIREGRKIDCREPNKGNRDYLAKILREEALKQFDDWRRPLLEFVLNSIDARPPGTEEYDIDVRTKADSFFCRDAGVGMQLEEVITHLTTPFNTEKDGVREIGRFGVGFLSSLHYCLQDRKTRIRGRTTTAEGTTDICLYGESSKVEDLRMKLTHNGKAQGKGTQIQVNRVQSRKLPDYFKEQLVGIPSFTARISLNGKPLNYDGDTTWYRVPATFEHRGEKLEQEVGLGIKFAVKRPKRFFDLFRKKPAQNGHTIRLTSQGVLVGSVKNSCVDTTVSFPPAAQLVEGRDEFKVDSNYYSARAAAFAALEQLITDLPRIDTDTFVVPSNEDMLEYIPVLLQAFSMGSVSQIPNIEVLRGMLLDGVDYVLEKDQYNDLQPFFGDVLEKVAAPVTISSYNAWSPLYPGKRDFLRDNMTNSQDTPVLGLKQGVSNGHYSQNLSLLSENVYRFTEVDRIVFVDIHTSDAPNALHYRDGELYINRQHRDVVGDYDPIKEYSLFTSFIALYERRHSTNKMDAFSGIERHTRAFLGRVDNRNRQEVTRFG